MVLSYQQHLKLDRFHSIPPLGDGYTYSISCFLGKMLFTAKPTGKGYVTDNDTTDCHCKKSVRDFISVYTIEQITGKPGPVKSRQSGIANNPARHTQRTGLT